MPGRLLQPGGPSHKAPCLAIACAANLVGSLALLALVVAAGIVPPAGAATSVALKKTSLTFTQVRWLPERIVQGSVL